jgi:hypothetical protein
MQTFSQLIKENISIDFLDKNFSSKNSIEKINENKIIKFNSLIETVSIEDYFQDRLDEVFESNYDETLVKNILNEFDEHLEQRDDDLKQILEESILNEKVLNEWASDEQLTFLDNDVTKNFNTFKRIITNLNVAEFMYYNRDGLPRGLYRKRTAEPFEISRNNKTKRVIMSGYIVSNFTKSNNVPYWRFYLLCNVKNIKEIKRKTRVVRPLWAGGSIKGHSVLFTIASVYKPTNKRDTVKTIKKQSGDVKIPTATKFGTKPEPKKSMYQPPVENNTEDSDEDGESGFEND